MKIKMLPIIFYILTFGFAAIIGASDVWSIKLIAVIGLAANAWMAGSFSKFNWEE